MCARSPEAVDAGFSLIETLVALALFALASVGLMQMQAQSLRLLTAAETRTLAELVAQNHLAEAMTGLRPFQVGEREGETELAGRVWIWREQVEQTQDARVVQVAEEVAAPGEVAPSARLVAFARGGP